MHKEELKQYLKTLQKNLQYQILGIPAEYAPKEDVLIMPESDDEVSQAIDILMKEVLNSSD